MYKVSLTFHLSDAAQGVFQRVQRARLAALIPRIWRQMKLQFLQSFEQLFLCLRLGRLFTTAGVQNKGIWVSNKIILKETINIRLRPFDCDY